MTTPRVMVKRRVSDLALFGGPALFDHPLPIGQLAMPDRDSFFAYAHDIFVTRRLTNNGPLVQHLESRLAELHGVEYCVAFANASLAIIVLLHQLSAGRRGEVIMPAFTYVGLPHLAQWAGQFPRFCDVDSQTHTLSPQAVAAVINEHTSAILGVHQVHAPCDIDALTRVADAHKIPLVFDAVHGIGCTYNGKAIGGFGQAEVFSLHATKLLNGFEGGYITTNDKRLAEAMCSMRNFGFVGESEVATLGMNAKLNELHAACALAGIDRLPQIIENNRERIAAYEREFSTIPDLDWISYGNGDEDRNYEFALLRISGEWPLNRDQLVDLIRAEGALARAYYSPPLHLSLHCPPGAATSLPITERLAGEFIQMPVGELVGLAEVKDLATLFAFLYSHADEIGRRLAEAGGLA